MRAVAQSQLEVGKGRAPKLLLALFEIILWFQKCLCTGGVATASGGG